MSDAGLERELKFSCPDLAAVQERLAELQAERVSASAREDNRVFDHQGELGARGCLLRLRTDRHGALVTFKGPSRFEGHAKVRFEHQTRVEEAEELQKIFESLGYGVVRRYQKKREEWRLGGVTVALDHTPIGDYVEFEGEGAETVARRCGFDAEQAERRTYLELYDDHLRENPGAPPDMVFS